MHNIELYDYKENVDKKEVYAEFNAEYAPKGALIDVIERVRSELSNDQHKAFTLKSSNHLCDKLIEMIKGA